MWRVWKDDLGEMWQTWTSWRPLSRFMIIVNVLGATALAWYIIDLAFGDPTCQHEACEAAAGVGRSVVLLIWVVLGAAFNTVFGIILVATERKE